MVCTSINDELTQQSSQTESLGTSSSPNKCTSTNNNNTQYRNSPGTFNRKPKKLHILNKMERERREQLERMKQSQQPTPKTSLSESMNRLSLNSDQIQSISDSTFNHSERIAVQPDKSSPQHIKTTLDLTAIEANKENPIHNPIISTNLSSSNVINTTSILSSQSNSSFNCNYDLSTKTIPKTPQSQKTKQLFKRKMISPMQNLSLVKEEDEDLTTVSKRLTFENTTSVRQTAIPTRLINESKVKLSTPEKTLTKRITLHKTSNVRKAPDVPFSLKFVF